MLRILNSTELNGFCLKNPGGPPFELLAGNVISITPDGNDYIVCLRGTVYEESSYQQKFARIRFKDRGANRKMLATRLEAVNLAVGNFVSVFCMISNGERIALEFRFNGRWVFRGWAGEKNVIIGKVISFKDKPPYAFAKFMEYGYKKQEAQYTWYVQFTKTAAEYARMYLSKDSPFTVCVCGAGKKVDQQFWYYCNSFEVI